MGPGSGAAGFPDQIDKLEGMAQGLDVAFFAAINGADGDPGEAHVPAHTADNHFNFKFKTFFTALQAAFHYRAGNEAVAGLVVVDRLAHGP